MREQNTERLTAIAVAVFGLLSLLIVNHGPWNRPGSFRRRPGRFAAVVSMEEQMTRQSSIIEDQRHLAHADLKCYVPSAIAS